MNNRRKKTSLTKYTSHFIARFACERELETDQRLQHIDLTHPSRHSRVSFSFSWCSTGGPGAQVSAECWLSLPHLVTNRSPKLLGALRAPSAEGINPNPTTSCLQLIWSTHLGAPRAPSAGRWLSLPQLYLRLLWSSTLWLPVLTELYNSSIAHSIFGMACLIVIKRK